MNKIVAAVTILLLAAFTGHSQYEKESSDLPVYFRFNFPGIVDPYDHNLSVGIEKQFHPNWSTGSDVAWIFYSNYLRRNKGANGIMVRPFIRWYLTEGREGFLEAELHYKYVSYQMEDWIAQEAVNGVPNFEEFRKFRYNKHTAGFHLKGGTRLDLSRNKRLKMEFAAGIGLRWKWQGADSGVYLLNGGFFTSNTFSPTYFSATLPVTMRLLYKL